MEQAAAVEDIVIARAGRPVARLGRFDAPVAGAPRVLGGLAGQRRVLHDFDAPLPDDLLASFGQS
nr:type II toxin-antitoxin system prevent-host-death family antitoxin [uncultured Lichenicoccus sp.]